MSHSLDVINHQVPFRATRHHQLTIHSIYPPSQTIEDTEKIVERYLPSPSSSSAPSKTHPPPTSAEDATKKDKKLAYAVHETSQDGSSRFIGLVNLVSLSGHSLPLPEHLVIPKGEEKDTLVVELAYSFLPLAWGKGYATEAVTAVLGACQSGKSKEFWTPWERVWMRVIVNGGNPPSQRVMAKCGIKHTGIFKWKGERIFLGGEWRTEDDLWIYGCYLQGGKGEE